MNNKIITYNSKTNRLYVSRPLVISLIISGLTLLGLFIFWITFLYAFSTTQYSFDQRKLGEAPLALQKTANDPDKIAGVLVKTRTEQYKNTLNILFFLDGYTKSTDGVVYANTLKTALGNDPYFKKLLSQISTTIFTGEGNKCRVENQKLACEKRTMEAFAGLGIPHIKIVILSPLDFSQSADQAYGKDSFITISTARTSALDQQFLDGLRKSISLNLLPLASQEQYLNGVMYCFYGNKESYIWPDGKFNSCNEFIKKYPRFWKE